MNLTKMTGIQHGVDISDDDMDVIIAAAASFVMTTVAAQTSILAVLKRRVRKRRVGPYRRRTDHTITPLIDDDTECRKLLGVPRAVVGLGETTLLPQIQPRAGLSVLDQVVTLLVWLWHYPRLSLLSAISGNVGEATTHRVIVEVLDLFVTSFDSLIRMPAGAAARGRFVLHHSLVGVLDGTALGIRRPTIGQDRFYRGDKHRHFVSMLILCDPAGYILWIGVGYPGHNNDQANYSSSSLRAWLLAEGHKVLTDGGFFGDELIRPVIKPDNPLLEYYNNLVQDERAIIEHVNSDIKEIEVLGSRFRGNRLLLTKAAVAVAILHNMKVITK